jgi:hypothetical protein
LLLSGEEVTVTLVTSMYYGSSYNFSLLLASMTPKKPTAFRLDPIDIHRLESLARKLECSQSAVIRKALKLLAEREGVR